MTRTARPIADVTVADWINGYPPPQPPLYSKLNDQSDDTYVQATQDSHQYFEVKLADTGDPATSSGHVVYIRPNLVGGHGDYDKIQWFLYQGSTLIASSPQILHNFIGDASFTLSAAEADSITNYADLRVRVVQIHHCAGEIYRVYEVWMETPGSLVDGEAAFQGVATATIEGSPVREGAAALQGVATATLDGTLNAGGETALQGIARLTAEAEGVPFLDFTTYDAYLESGATVQGLMFYDDPSANPQTVSVKLNPTRTDVGNNPDEIRPEFGFFFAQSDFSHGEGQRYYHQPGRDPKKYFYSDGFDISEPGKLTHLHAIAAARSSTTIGALVQAGSLPFVINGTNVDRGDGNFPGTWTAESPHVAETPCTVEDLVAEGARIFAALGVNGVHVRSSAGTWSHFQPDGTTDLNISPATRVAWVKERLMVVGGTGSRAIYEIAASSTPTAIETLPEGWTFEAIFEAGGFIHACAVNVNAGLSKIHHYGLNSGLTALEKKASTWLPKDQLAYSGAGYLGLAHIGVAKRNADGGYDPVLYKATIDSTSGASSSGTGALDYAEVREQEGSGANDLGVRAITTIGEAVLVGWSLGSGAFGGARDGIAIYHIARDAFANHLRKTAAGGAKRVLDIMPYKGRILISIAGDGLYYEDLSTFYTDAILVTSLADWNNAGAKVWDQVEISHDPLPAAGSVHVEYATKTFEEATWAVVLSSSVTGAEGISGRLSNVKSRVFALRITSVKGTTEAPEILGYVSRSLPSPARPEFSLTRYVRLLGRDRKDENGELVYQDPDELLRFLQDAIYSSVTFYEAGFSWTGWLEDVSTVEPAQPFVDETSGDPLEDVFVVRLQLTATR